MRGGEGFVVVFSLTDRKSFQEVRYVFAFLSNRSEFRDRTLRVKDKDKVPMILVGNKADLEDQRAVTKEEGEQLAKQFDVPYIETSAQTGSNTDEVFFQIAKLIRDAGPAKKK